MSSSQYAQATSQIFLRNLHFTAAIGTDVWGRRGKPQPAFATVRLAWDVELAARYDRVEETLNYSDVCKQILGMIQHKGPKGFESVEHFNYCVCQALLDYERLLRDVSVTTTLPKAILHSEKGYSFHSVYQIEERRAELITYEVVAAFGEYCIDGLKVPCIIGVNPHEQATKQDIIAKITYGCLIKTQENISSGNLVTPQAIADIVFKNVEHTSFKTLEALAYYIKGAIEHAKFKFEADHLRLTIAIEKPSAILAVDGSGVEVSFELATRD